MKAWALAIAVLIVPVASHGQSVANSLAPKPAPVVSTPQKPAAVTTYAPATPPAATAAPQLAPQYRETMSQIEFLPNETNEEYVKRMTVRREAAQQELTAASQRHAAAMKALREQFRNPGQ